MVVKVSYGYSLAEPEPRLELMADQPGFDEATPGAGAGYTEGELAAAGDLVAAKLGTDVLLRGRAYGPSARERIDARLRVGDQLDCAFCVVGTKSDQLPLRGGYLRDRDGATPIPPVGPMRPRPVRSRSAVEALEQMTAEERRQELDATLRAIYGGEYRPWEAAGLGGGGGAEGDVDEEVSTSDEGAATGPEEVTLAEVEEGPLEWDDLTPADSPLLDDGVQHAAAHMVCGPIDRAQVFELQGLRPGGERQKLRLPGHEVLVVFEGHDATYDVTMMVDTVQIDTVAGQLSLSWRGQLPEDAFGWDEQRLIVALADGAHWPALDDLYRNLPRAHFARASVPRDADLPEPARPDLDLELARQMTFHRTPDPQLELEHYARVAAELWAAPESRADVLSRHGMDAVDWMLEERAWLARVGQALQAGDLATVKAYGKLVNAARAEQQATRSAS